MKNIQIIIVVFSFLLIFAACEKETTPPSPTVHVHQPTAGTTYNSGDTVWIEAHYTDEDELHECHLDVKNTTSDTTFLHVHAHSHGTSYEIDTFVVVTASMHSDFQLTAMGTNHNSLSTTETVDFHVHP